MTTTKKRIPADPYECWCMPCQECEYFNPDIHECEHPKAVERRNIGYHDGEE